MAIEVVPASAARFEDLAAIVGPSTPGAQACWCLAYRIRSVERQALGPAGQADLVRALCSRDLAPGVLAYDEGVVVGWAGVAPRAELYGFRRGSRIPWLDEAPVWSVWCFRVRGGHRRQGVAGALLAGAVEFARDHGAPAVEGYPVDNQGARLDGTLAFVGTRSMFEKAGFTRVSDTAAVAARLPRVLMRLELT
ncbi:MAG TPA: GNAT family N-acetyltransferase [Cellulomonas sp.]